MRALQRFWSQSTGAKVIVLAVAGAIVLIGGFGALLVSGTLPSGINGSKTTSAIIVKDSTPAATHATAGSSVSTVSITVTAQAGVPTATAIVGGPPQLGAPLADFIAAYGQPTLQQSLAATDDFWGDSQHTILIGVDVTKGVATQISVVGPPLSTSSQTYNSCAAFLPSDATSYNSAPPDTDFHSSIGDLVLESDGEGLCMVYVVAS